MTHSGGKEHEVGDRGQRYEVGYYSMVENKRKILGWTDTWQGAKRMEKSINLRHNMESPHIRDRKK